MKEHYEWWTSSDGRIELKFEEEDVVSVARQGRVDEEVVKVSNRPYVRKQLERLDPDTITNCLTTYGVWRPHELGDLEVNKQRLVWLACGDIYERFEL